MQTKLLKETSHDAQIAQMTYSFMIGEKQKGRPGKEEGDDHNESQFH